MNIQTKNKTRLLSRLALSGIEIPKWVPERFVTEYADCALHFGEEQAASHVRKLKREFENSELSRLVSRG